MSDFQQALLLSSFAALAIPIGGALATVSRIRPRWLETGARHAIMAFGAGALLSAVALVLIPEGVAELSMTASSLCFAAGGAGFYLLDRVLTRAGGAGAQPVAMLSDFVPEAIALGAALATGKPTAAVLACMIALRNLPEGFNAQRELEERSPESTIRRGCLYRLCCSARCAPPSVSTGWRSSRRSSAV